LYNVEITRKGEEEVRAKYAGEELTKGKKLQWVSEPNECEVLRVGDLLKDGKYNPESLVAEKGYCEKAVLELKKGTLIQFERYGFCRLDSLEPLRFIYTC